MTPRTAFVVFSSFLLFLPAHKAWRKRLRFFAIMLATTGLNSAMFHACGEGHIAWTCLGMTTGTFLRIDSALSYCCIALTILIVSILCYLRILTPWGLHDFAYVVCIAPVIVAYAIVDDISEANEVSGVVIGVLAVIGVLLYWWFSVWKNSKGDAVHHGAVITTLLFLIVSCVANVLATEPTLAANYPVYHGFWHAGIAFTVWAAMDIICNITSRYMESPGATNLPHTHNSMLP